MSGPHAGAPFPAVDRVHAVNIGPDQNVYFIGDFSFDEADKDPEYIEMMIQVWSRWKDYVEHGE